MVSDEASRFAVDIPRPVEHGCEAIQRWEVVLGVIVTFQEVRELLTSCQGVEFIRVEAEFVVVLNSRVVSAYQGVEVVDENIDNLLGFGREVLRCQGDSIKNSSRSWIIVGSRL